LWSRAQPKNSSVESIVYRDCYNQYFVSGWSEIYVRILCVRQNDECFRRTRVAAGLDTGNGSTTADIAMSICRLDACNDLVAVSRRLKSSVFADVRPDRCALKNCKHAVHDTLHRSNENCTRAHRNRCPAVGVGTTTRHKSFTPVGRGRTVFRVLIIIVPLYCIIRPVVLNIEIMTIIVNNHGVYSTTYNIMSIYLFETITSFKFKL